MHWKRISAFVDLYALSIATYTLVGGASAIVEWSVFYALHGLLTALSAAILAFFVATTANYVLSRTFAFRSVRSQKSEVLLLFALSGVAFLFNLGVFLALYQLLHVNAMAAKIIGTGVGFTANFAARQFLVFSTVPRFAAFSSLLTVENDASQTSRTDNARVARPRIDITAKSK